MPAFFCALALLAACGNKGNAKKPGASGAGKTLARPPVSVTVSLVEQHDVPLQLRVIGTAEAFSSIQVKSMVGGQITQVHFQEGQDVKKGETLFTIDQRPFQSTAQQARASLIKSQSSVKEARANLERDLAQAKTAELTLARYETLVKDSVVSKDEYDKVRTAAETLKATVAADRAAIENAEAAVKVDQSALENAEIMLGYTTILAPIDGRTGNLEVNAGNLVKANDTPALVSINQISPIYVTFSVPEKELPAIKHFQSQGPLLVEAFSPADPANVERGTLTFIDNTVDAQTGTIKLKGTFENQSHRLWPGQFLNVMLTLTHQQGALVIPSQALQSGQQGDYVFVIKSDQTAESRPVQVDRILNNRTIIKQGLTPGDRVVTDGHLQLVPGARVTIKPSVPQAAGKDRPTTSTTNIPAAESKGTQA